MFYCVSNLKYSLFYQKLLSVMIFSFCEAGYCSYSVRNVYTEKRMNNGNVHFLFLVVSDIAATAATIKYTASPPSKR